MKNFNFKSKKTVIKTLKEPPRPTKINWQRYSWLAIITTVVLVVVFRVFDGVAILRGQGLVELGKQAVMFTNDIKVLKFGVKEGAEVKFGDTLFYYKNELDRNGNMISGINLERPIGWIEREKLNIKKQIALKQIEKKNLKTQLQFKQKEFKHQQDLVLLGINNIEYTLTGIQSQILKSETQFKILKEEIAYLRKYYAQLRSQERATQSLELQQMVSMGDVHVYTAQMNGIIGDISFAPNEVCYKRQHVLTIHQKNEISIRAYFDPEYINYLKKDDILDIQFPDGSEGQGKVTNFYVATHALPAEFQNKYEPVERNVVVDVLPLSEEESKRWTNFYKMTVDVSKFKFEFLSE